jgi:hypothetical protein
MRHGMFIYRILPMYVSSFWTRAQQVAAGPSVTAVLTEDQNVYLLHHYGCHRLTMAPRCACLSLGKKRAMRGGGEE